MYGRRAWASSGSDRDHRWEGIVRQVFPKVRVDGHSEAVLAAIKALKP